MNTGIEDVERTVGINNKGDILLSDTFDEWKLGSYKNETGFHLETNEARYTNGADYNKKSGDFDDLSRVKRGNTTIKWTCNEAIAHNNFNITEATETEQCGYNFEGLINCCDVPYPGNI